jgi:hypothetical protein
MGNHNRPLPRNDSLKALCGLELYPHPIRIHPSDPTPELLSQKPDTGDEENLLSGRRYVVLKSQDTGATFTYVLDGAFVPTALDHVVRPNGTGSPFFLSSFPECSRRRFLNRLEGIVHRIPRNGNCPNFAAAADI